MSVPALDPREPGIYRLIIDTADRLREQRQADRRSLLIARAAIERSRMRSATKLFSELDSEVVTKKIYDHRIRKRSMKV
jgi:hypothetical protein